MGRSTESCALGKQQLPKNISSRLRASFRSIFYILFLGVHAFIISKPMPLCIISNAAVWIETELALPQEIPSMKLNKAKEFWEFVSF